MKTYTVTQVCNDLYNIMKQINKNEAIVEIMGLDGDNVIMISKKHYQAIEETLYLSSQRVLEVIHNNEHDETLQLNVVDWDEL